MAHPKRPADIREGLTRLSGLALLVRRQLARPGHVNGRCCSARPPVRRLDRLPTRRLFTPKRSWPAMCDCAQAAAEVRGRSAAMWSDLALRFAVKLSPMRRCGRVGRPPAQPTRTSRQS